MGLYNFQPRFAPFIRAWVKNPNDPRAKAHTIRAPRASSEDEPGSTMYLYVGLRRSGARRIIDPPVCTRRESIVIRDSDDAQLPFDVWVGPFLERVLADKLAQQRVIRAPEKHGLAQLDGGECEVLARRDGFGSFAEMMRFWGGRLPFYGHIFHWGKQRAKGAAR